MNNLTFTDPAVLDDPFAVNARYRREAPVYFHEPWRSGFIFRQEDIATLSRDGHLSNRRMDMFVNAGPEHLRKDLEFLETELGGNGADARRRTASPRTADHAGGFFESGDPERAPQWLRMLGVRGPITLPVIAGASDGSSGGL